MDGLFHPVDDAPHDDVCSASEFLDSRFVRLFYPQETSSRKMRGLGCATRVIRCGDDQLDLAWVGDAK